jgi:hypothetical protein
MLRIGTFAGSVIFGLAFLVLAQESLPKGAGDGKKPETISRAASVRKALGELIDIPQAIQEPNSATVRQVLSLLNTQLATKGVLLEIFIDQTSFSAETPDSQKILEYEVKYPASLRALTVQQAFDILIDQIPTLNATYLVKDGRIVVTTHEAARISYLLDQGIAVQLRDVPLKVAIEELGERAGVTIMVDPRCGAEMNKSVSLQTQNDASLRGILSSWADMNDLKLVVDEHRVMLMPRGDYLKKLRDQLEEAKLLSQILKTETFEPSVLLPLEAQPRQRGRKSGSGGA